MNKIEFFRSAKAPFAARYGNFIGGKWVKLRIPRHPTAHSSNIRPAVPRASDRSAASA